MNNIYNSPGGIYDLDAYAVTFFNNLPPVGGPPVGGPPVGGPPVGGPPVGGPPTPPQITNSNIDFVTNKPYEPQISEKNKLLSQIRKYDSQYNKDATVNELTMDYYNILKRVNKLPKFSEAQWEIKRIIASQLPNISDNDRYRINNVFSEQELNSFYYQRSRQ
jgi:nucleoside diphosphate kinase